MSKAIERNPIRHRGLTMIPYGSREEWLKIRRNYIGGSDAGAIVGMNPYASAFSVWAEKTGQVPEFQGNISTRTGTLLEDLVARLFMEETGKRVQKLNFTLVNEDYPFACANIDREILNEDAILECKTTNSIVNVKKFRNGEFPEQWYCQVMHYMAVTGAKKGYLAVLSECRDFRIFELERDEDEIAALMQAEEKFWCDYVLARKTPPVDGHSATGETIKALYSEDSGESIDLGDCDRLFDRRKALTGQQKALKEEIDGIDNEIKVRLGNASRGLCGRWSVTWKEQRTAALDRDAIRADYPDIDFGKYATTARVFRVTEKKEKTA